MFKKPLRVEVNADDSITIEHKIDINPNVYYRTHTLVKTTGKVAINVIVVAAVAKTSSEILTHIVKTRIK